MKQICSPALSLVLSSLALLWIAGTGACRSSTEGTSVPVQQPAPPAAPEPPSASEPPAPEPPAAPEPAAPNASCGGLQGLACDSGEYCHYVPSQMCGAADQLGSCRVIPEFCTQQFDPVCGCDDKTYSNSCKANAAGISAATTEPCPER